MNNVVQCCTYWNEAIVAVCTGMVVVDEIGLAYCTMNIVQYRVSAAAISVSVIPQPPAVSVVIHSATLCIAQKQKPSIAVDFLRMSQNDFGTDDPATKIDSYYSFLKRAETHGNWFISVS